jgi:hypothetical protein
MSRAGSWIPVRHFCGYESNALTICVIVYEPPMKNFSPRRLCSFSLFMAAIWSGIPLCAQASMVGSERYTLS